jgi:hypothetical protein
MTIPIKIVWTYLILNKDDGDEVEFILPFTDEIEMHSEKFVTCRIVYDHKSYGVNKRQIFDNEELAFISLLNELKYHFKLCNSNERSYIDHEDMWTKKAIKTMEKLRYRYGEDYPVLFI